MVDVVYLQIDGSLHEGGGQIIRSSMALSNILQKPIQLKNIRVNRPNPGLNNQLMGAIKLMREISKAQVVGDKQKSLKITYEPQMKIKSGNYAGGSQSAAAISLMVQSLIPTMIFGKAQSTIKLQGGSDVNKSPPFETIQRILKPLLEKMGIHFNYNLITEGYYPRGGGQIQLEVQPIADYIKPITITKRTVINKIYLQFILTETCEKAQKDYFRPLKKDIISFLVSKQPGIKEEDIEFEVDVKQIKNKKYKECYSIVAHAYGSEDNYFAFSFYNDDDLKVEVIILLILIILNDVFTRMHHKKFMKTLLKNFQKEAVQMNTIKTNYYCTWHQLMESLKLEQTQLSQITLQLAFTYLKNLSQKQKLMQLMKKQLVLDLKLSKLQEQVLKTNEQVLNQTCQNKLIKIFIYLQKKININKDIFIIILVFIFNKLQIVQQNKQIECYMQNKLINNKPLYLYNIQPLSIQFPQEDLFIFLIELERVFLVIFFLKKLKQIFQKQLTYLKNQI
ncbi:RNA 3'-terminal phosphate cyclase (macronuclear) [Tetrahymena thermophila SB210]|uniref:RNA 3'-terminal phosphate cyclase n=1 Tax=Tetrahymena thermophila (strain SB210) TaxID=312017 RepID=Q22PH2_TETTS|nr:RNA 3'-terminal phosphate cyclase [Tetrahymena thermophila SB210]EAR87137.2 RNA 3'-terminal phosphate cyclase [Tetrahymena thermophila SB210]|eukprot:XP_001007382.2 RNA 3'-terminal phosphate cyclase [Tetrahymena thermophila SB210]